MSDQDYSFVDISSNDLPTVIDNKDTVAQVGDITEYAKWHTQGYLTPEQLSWLVSSGSTKIQKAIKAVLDSMQSVSNKTVVCVAIKAVMQAHGFQEGNATNTKAESVKRPISSNPPLECIMVCVDRSGSMKTPFERDDDVRTVDRTRLDSVKQFFYGFRDRTTTYTDTLEGPHYVGLLSYSGDVKLHALPSPDLQVFEDTLDDMQEGGSTAIYAAIKEACQALAKLGKKFPEADLRVLVLTDGQNNVTKVTDKKSLEALSDIGAVCDCLLVGDSCDSGLKRLVTATDGLCFQIDSLADAYETLESDAVISLNARRNGAPKPTLAERRAQCSVDLSTVKHKAATKGCYVPPATNGGGGKVVKYLTSEEFLSMDVKEFKGKSHSSASLKRIKSEVQDSLQPFDSPSRIRLFPGLNADGEFVSVRAVWFIGTGIYVGQVVEIDLTYPLDYPFKPPSLVFRTPMYHYAINNSGSVCMDMLKDSWSPALTTMKVLKELLLLVEDPQQYDPSASNSLRSWLSELLRVDPAKYISEGKAHAAKNCKSHTTWNNWEDNRGLLDNFVTK
eukprot:m.333348 g.333348  ORF g.333348 m.333348 type:complete len:560 (+) comp17132_c0_seq1:173-1852(+)